MKQEKISLSRISQIIISLLFVSDIPLTSSNLAKLIKTSKKRVNLALEKAKKILEFSGLEVINTDRKYQLVTDPINANFVKKLVKHREEEKIGKASMEVLAIIAYRKPVTEEEIEMIRGIKSSRAIRNLMIKGMIVLKEVNGVKKYSPSLKFLRSLGIKKVEDLSAYQELAGDEELNNFLTQEQKTKC